MMAVTWKTGKPQKEGQYLVTTEDGRITTMGWAGGWNCIRELDGTICRKFEIDGVTAWTELPEPYKTPKRAIDGEELKRRLERKGGKFDLIHIGVVMNMIDCIPEYREEE